MRQQGGWLGLDVVGGELGVVAQLGKAYVQQ